MKEVWAPTAVRRQNYAEVYRLATVPLRSAHIPGPKSGRNAGLEAYIREQLPFITAQPNQRQDVVPSMLEHHMAAYTEEREREEEWSRIGVESRLNPLEYRRRKQEGPPPPINTVPCYFWIGLHLPFPAINRTMVEALRDSLGAAAFKVSAFSPAPCWCLWLDHSPTQRVQMPESLADILAALETTDGGNKNTKFGREVAIRNKQETGPKESDEV